MNDNKYLIIKGDGDLVFAHWTNFREKEDETLDDILETFEERLEDGEPLEVIVIEGDNVKEVDSLGII